MATDTATTPDLTTLAGRVQALGGGGLPETVLRITQDIEQKRRAIRADTKFSEAYRNEQIALLDQEEEAAVYAAQATEIAQAQQQAETRKGQIVSKLRSQFAHRVPAVETSSEQAERHFRSTQDSVGLLPDLIAAQAMTDPEDLVDVLEESLAAQHDARVRKLAPVVIARLATLAEQEHEGARQAWMSARSSFAAYKKAHPSLNAQLKAADAELQNVAAPIQRRFERALDYLKIGKHKRGMRIG